MSAAPHDTRMLLPSHFHPRLVAANQALAWYGWKGYAAAAHFDQVDYEYFAIRNATAVFDLCPMTKYLIEGADAEAYLNRLFTRDVRRIRPGRVGYGVWCDDAGQVHDDGTLFHLAPGRYRLCSQERFLDWLQWSALGFEVRITDQTADIAGIAVQGPTACATLLAAGLEGLQTLRPFELRHHPFRGGELMVSRTGFTGDLGYELWTAPELALSLWDAVFTAGKDRIIRPIGSTALNIARIEAGFVQAGTDFVPAEAVVRHGRGRSPFELGLDWLVDFDKGHFTGRRALLEERAKGSRYRFVRLDVEGNKPAMNSFIFGPGKRKVVGTVTSAAWCPTAKTNVAFASLDMPWGCPGDELWAEIYSMRELKWTRIMARARVVEAPVFDPPRRRQTPAPMA